MKKYLYSIFAALIAVACTTFEEEASLPVVKPGEPTITVTNLGETTITAKIDAPEGTGFFSYAVIAGKAAQLDSASLFKLGYKSKAVVYGTVDYKVAQSFEVVAGTAEKPLTRDADYTIYAVASSEQGYIGQVVSKTVHTPDTDLPKIGGATYNGNVMTLKFSEKVTYDETKPVTAKYYAVNLIALNGDKTALASDGLQGDAKAVVALAADGKSADVTVTLADGKPLPAGAYYAVNYPAGAFKDNAGNAIAGLQSGPVVNKGAIALAGAMGRIATKSFDLVDDDEEAETVAPSVTYFTYSFPEDVTYFDATKTPGATMTVVKSTASVSAEAVYTLGYGTDWGYVSAYGLILVQYPAAIDIVGGNDLVISIAAGSFQDIYGNTNAELTHEYLYSFGYTVDDFIGTYSYVGQDSDGVDHTEDAVVIAPDPENEDGFLIYGLFSSMPNVSKYFTTWSAVFEPLAADLDPDTGVISIEKSIVIEAESAAFAGAYGYSGTFSAAFEMQAPAAGEINTAWRYYMDGTEYYWSDEEGKLTRTSTDYVVPSEPVDDSWKDSATALGTTETANSYIVTAAGAYKIPAVKGVSADKVGTVASAALLWETYNSEAEVTANSVIEAVASDADYIYFKTPETLKPGNALIAAKDGDGVILWSWHIWIPATAIADVSEPTFYSAPLMDRNLGALEAVADAAAKPDMCTFGLYYQWGRKDPMFTKNWTRSATLDMAYSGNSDAGVSVTTEESLKTPTTYYYSQVDGNYNWNSSEVTTLWDDGTSPKTIYDPCPAGYRVPKYDAEYAMWKYNVADGWTSDKDNGWFKYGALTFPYAGYASSSSLSYSGIRSVIWSATYKDGERGWGIYIRSDKDPIYNYHSYYKPYLASVRCAKIAE